MTRSSTFFSWDRYARCYDVLNELRPYTQMLDRIKHLITPRDYPLLDAGCGTGNFLSRLSVPPEIKVPALVGMDSSASMLKRARDKCDYGVVLLPADLNQAISYPEASFNTVVCINALYAVTDPSFTLSEFYRLLRPSGRLILVTPKQGYENGYILRAHCRSDKPKDYWRGLHNDPKREKTLIEETFPEPKDNERFLELAKYNRSIARNCRFHFFSPGQIRMLLQSLGFTSITIGRTYASQNLLVTARKPGPSLKKE